MRTLIVFLVLLISLPAAHAAFGQDGTSYFHQGAQLYIDGAIAEAQTVVDEGLRVSPDDPRLQALKEKLEQQQQQSQQSQQDQQSEQQENQDASDSQNQQGDSEEQSDESEQSQQQDDEQSGEEEGEQEQQEEEERDGDQQQPVPSQTEPARDPERISEEQAMRILQALENQELQLLREARKPPSDSRRVEKDW